MNELINSREVRKATSKDIIEAMQFMSSTLANRSLDSADFDDIETQANKAMAEMSYDDPDELGQVIEFNEILIGVPSLKPRLSSSGVRKNGTTVVPLIHIPGQPPKYAWDTNSTTYKEKFDLNLRGPRSLAIHSILPGMMVSFHFYESDDGFKNRYKIIAKKIDYNSDGEPVIIEADESEAAVRMPDWESIV